MEYKEKGVSDAESDISEYLDLVKEIKGRPLKLEFKSDRFNCENYRETKQKIEALIDLVNLQERIQLFKNPSELLVSDMQEKVREILKSI